MKSLFICTILIFSISCYSQTHISNDTLYLSNGTAFTKGDTLHLGMGSNMSTREFNFIYTNPMSLAGMLKLGSAFANLQMVVHGVKEFSNKKMGTKYYLTLSGGNIVKYYCEIEPAIQSGEVVL